MRLLLVSTYELGHQPLHVASPAAALRAAGHDVRCVDVAVDTLDGRAVEWADAVAISVPMHTALRLAVVLARRLRERRPQLPLCLYGVYAPLGRDLVAASVADRVIAGEYEPALLRWAASLAAGERPAAEPLVQLGRGRGAFTLPARDLLPPLDRYARYREGSREVLVGAVEATHGCIHTCRHCPLPVVYGGRLRVVDAEVLLADVDQLVEAGAGHLTFADPDFLNGPGHVLPIVRALHARHPELTFDCTVKVEHVLRHAAIWPELAASGCRFVVSAVESLDEQTLHLLDKGHTAADAGAAVHLLRAQGIEPRPTFLPFTPWTTPEHVRDILAFVADHDLVGNVDPVQYSIRLLLPPGSLLLDLPEVAGRLDGYDAEGLTHRWRSLDPAMDDLQRAIAAAVERAAEQEQPAGRTFLEVVRLVAEAGGRLDDAPQLVAGSTEGRPRLTEPWFC